MTVEGLLKTISAEELTDWQAFERLEPIGQMPLRRQLAHFMSIFYNAIPTKTKRKTAQPEHFLIGDTSYLTGSKPKQSVSQMKAIMESIKKSRED